MDTGLTTMGGIVSRRVLLMPPFTSAEEWAGASVFIPSGKGAVQHDSALWRSLSADHLDLLPGKLQLRTELIGSANS